jgi:hypothetical protein
MSKWKQFVTIALAGLAFILMMQTAKSDSMTPSEFVNNLSQVPGKVQSHISMEIEKTKEFQAKNWIKMKEDFLKLKNIFIKN